MFIIFLLPLLLLQGCSEPSEPVRETQSERAVIPGVSHPSSLQLTTSAQGRIKTALVEKRMLSQGIVAPGGVALDLGKMAKVSSRLEGQVEEVFVQLGNHVKRGDPLLAIGSLKLDELVQEFLVSKVQSGFASRELREDEKTSW